MGLLNDNLLFVDRETDSIWSQLDGRAISGDFEGAPLEMVPSIQTTWGFWREKHPNTRVMILAEEGRPYVYRDRSPGEPPPEEPATEHVTKRLGLGLAFGDAALFLPFHELDGADLPLELELGGQSVVVFYEKAALTAWAEDPDGNLLPSVLAYDFGWRDFFPETEVFKAGEP